MTKSVINTTLKQIQDVTSGKPVDGISMTSLEIAERTGKRHDHVMRDIKVMLLELHGEISLPKFGGTYKATNGQEYDCYKLPKDEVLCLISGYSIKLRMAIIKRLDELEQQPAFQLPQNYAEALRQLADTEEEKQAALLQIEHDQPKVHDFDTFLETKSHNTLRETAKILKLSPNKFTAMLRADKICYSLNGNGNTPYQSYVDRDLFVIKMNHGFSQTYVTQQGVSFLNRKYREPQQRLLF